MIRAAVFIDGGYLSKILKDRFGQAVIDYGQFAKWAAEGYEIFRTYYYDCPPYQSAHPTEDERRRTASRQAFFTALNRLDRFSVRLGRLAYRGTNESGEPIFEQKRVDLQLGLDLAFLVAKSRVEMVVLVSGDSDLIPAVRTAREQGALVRLVHGPRTTYHQDLWDEADERREMTADVIRKLRRQ